jgi:hypothetical protein
MGVTKYEIYPTLIDSFYWAKRLGKWDELLDKVNRVKSEMAEPALKGIAFEACVNKAIIKPFASNMLIDTFEFDSDLINKVAKKLCNSIKQQEYIQANLETKYGAVKLYGFVDYSYPEMYIDLKTTGSYKIGKFNIYNQHKAYPLINQLNGGKVHHFNYLVTDFKEMYIEQYPHTKINDR